jgi:hypothetical protein
MRQRLDVPNSTQTGGYNATAVGVLGVMKADMGIITRGLNASLPLKSKHPCNW